MTAESGRTHRIELTLSRPERETAKAEGSPGVLRLTVTGGDPALRFVSIDAPDGSVGLRTAFQGASGEFPFAPGDYRILVVSGTGFGRTDVRVRPGETTEEVVALAPGGTVRGSVPKGPAWVDVIDPSTGHSWIGALADEEGRFEFQGVPPGGYLILAREADSGWEIGRSSPGVIAAGDVIDVGILGRK
jgi:hypothetical protein